MDPVALLALINGSLSLLQGLANMSGAFDQVSKIIGKRIAEGRVDWSDQEENEILTALINARQSAVDAVDKLP